MRKNSVLIVLSLFVLSCYCQDFTFAGLWTDDVEDSGWGGNFSVCIVGDTAYGLFSEYGLAVGLLSEDGTVWSGTYYQGGELTDDCIDGVFSLNLLDNGTRFEGLYGCRDTLLKPWSSDRINLDEQTPYECGQVMTNTNKSANLNGRWWKKTNNHLSQVDFCTDSDGGFQASYYNPTFTPEGYDEGVWYTNNKIATGVFYRANQDGALPGRSVWFINSDGNLANLWWAGFNEELNIADINDTLIHGYDIYQFSRGTTVDECERFSSLANQDYDYYPLDGLLFDFEPYYRQYPLANVSSDYYTSNASSLGYSSALILLISLFFLC